MGWALASHAATGGVAGPAPPGSAFAWGYNASGQIGDGTTGTDRPFAVSVSGLTGVTSAAGGDTHGVAVKSDGTVTAWGSNSSGQLGDGTSTARLTPGPVPGLTGVTAIAAARSSNFALKSDGTVTAWGSNSSGQLGDGTITTRRTPVTVAGLSGVKAVASGATHTVALKSDGTVLAWGSNSSGQLGDGTNIPRTTPTPVPGLTGVTGIAAGGSHSIAVKSDGSVLAWGAGGRVGDGTSTSRLTPVAVPNLTGVTAVAAGLDFSLAHKNDGTVMSWGNNPWGQLGDGTTTNRLAPVSVVGLTGVRKVAAGSLHGLAILADRSAVAWGDNFHVKLGAGVGTNQSAPVAVRNVRGLLDIAGGLHHSVAVVDNVPPTLTLPAAQSIEAEAAQGTKVTWQASATDAVDGPAPVTCSPASGTFFPIATTTVTCSATDTTGNKGTGTFAVTVKDSRPPTLALPPDLAREATGPQGAVVTYQASARDVVDGDVAPDCSPSSGQPFPLGTTKVSCTARDSRGNAASGAFNVTIIDTTPPRLAIPAEVRAEATGPHGANITYETSATDTVDGPLDVVCSLPPGGTAPIGTTAVTCSATDRAGNAGRGDFTATVVDTSAPVLDLGDVTVEATASSGAAVSYHSAASDAVDGPTTPRCTPSSGTRFPIGRTTVSCTARDSAGNESSGDFTVAVVDSTPPAIALPADITAEATSSDGAVVTFESSARDTVDGDVAVTCSPRSKHSFPLGATTVTCTAKDSRDNARSAAFGVTVRDSTAPRLVVPADRRAEATGPEGATIVYDTAAVDQVDGALLPTCSPPSGATFPVGATNVTCTVADRAGNTTSASFSAIVSDTTPPALELPPETTAEATGPDGAAITFVASATDAVDGTVPVSCSSPSGATYPLGTTSVRCSTKDAAGNPTSGAFDIIIGDTTPPALTLPADLRVDATDPSGATVTYSATARDTVGGAIPVDCSPPSGATVAIGTTAVSCSATDPAGNTSNGTFNVTVRGADAQLSDLRVKTQTQAPGSSLSQKAKRAQAEFRAGNSTSACSILDAFVAEVRAQDEKKLSGDQADALSAAAIRIQSVIGCSD
jgi:alpha-tubulin suppressor-like RCC1 family protein